MMTPVLSGVTYVSAQRTARFLSFHQVNASIRAATPAIPEARFEVCVQDHHVEEARDLVALLVEGLAPGEEIPDVQSEEEAAAVPESSVSCPRCASRSVMYPDDPGIGLLMLLLGSLLFAAGIPLLVWFIHARVKGSLKRCKDCQHAWRSKP